MMYYDKTYLNVLNCQICVFFLMMVVFNCNSWANITTIKVIVLCDINGNIGISMSLNETLWL